MAADLGWRIAALRRPVSELRRSMAFYTRGLGFVADAPAEAGRALMRLGEECIELVEQRTPQAAQWPPGPDVRFQHAAIVAADMAAAFERLARLSPRAISRHGPQRLPAAAGGVQAFKFFDPDGHPLELLAFPPGTGKARWQAGSGAGPTLGIDHFALSVSDVARSIAFYEHTLGLTLAARQTNRGPEQAWLDGLDGDGVVVDVVAMASAVPGTPHVELLGYRQPAPRTHESLNPPAAVDCLLFEREAGPATPADRAGAVFARDPDGHAFACAPTGVRP
ncbi:VOC family protein [Roseateles sp.]|uniref:VOC family protein n=1 Tax=Roseateles sp. TaxID=1971397 RepID=UPI003262F11C